jgi:hypothetical protein
MNLLALGIALTLNPARDAAVSIDRPTVVVVVGAPGAPEYGREFKTWADRWNEAAGRTGAGLLRIGLGAENAERKADAADGESRSDRDALRAAIAGADRPSQQPLWVVLIGHGTWDGRTARFNLRGPDVTAAELAEWLPAAERPTVVINGASSSGPFIDRLAAPGRIVVTATRSGHETNFARFGDALSASIADPQADLDQDGQTSLLEAWLIASRRTEEFYKTAGRLPTEHPLLDDTGDGRGVQPGAFAGVRPAERSSDNNPVDGYRAHQVCLVPSDHEQRFSAEQRDCRDALELQLFALRDRRVELPEEQYEQQLERILVELATLYEQADSE